MSDRVCLKLHTREFWFGLFDSWIVSTGSAVLADSRYSLENPDHELDLSNSLDDHNPSMTQEDDLNDLFFEMSSEDVGNGGPLLLFSPPNALTHCDQLLNTDPPNKGFKFDEIPRKLRAGYNEAATNSEQFEWKSNGTQQRGMEQRINEVAQEFIATQSLVSQTFTSPFSSSQPYAQFHCLSESKPAQDIRPCIEGSSLPIPSQDPRSLECAVRIQSSSALSERNSQDYSLTSYNYVPHAIPSQIAQPYAALSQTVPQSYSPFPIHHPVYQPNSQSYTVQSEYSQFYNYSYSPLYNYQIPVPQQTNQHSTQALSGSTPQTSHHIGMASREVGTTASAARQPSRVKNEPMKEKLVEVLKYSEGHTQLPRAPLPKRRRTSSADASENDSCVGSSVCTSLSSLMAIHGGYSKSLSRNDV
uniref:2-isopropylmalate synthase 2 n=1 Tax=Lygus hesperus TaxID=30085 RepID=A0A0A9YDS4_LYGHE